MSEVKTTAENLDHAQLEGLLALANGVSALPVIAGLTGTFGAEMTEAVPAAGGRVFHRAQLLA